MPQKHLEHHLLTASATVDGNKVTMLVDNGSENAEAPLTVVNTRGFDLPETGDNGTLMFTVFGILIMAGAAGVLYIATRKKKA
jgi:LPXTG-motif cell wall-anchored protein